MRQRVVLRGKHTQNVFCFFFFCWTRSNSRRMKKITHFTNHSTRQTARSDLRSLCVFLLYSIRAFDMVEFSRVSSDIERRQKSSSWIRRDDERSVETDRERDCTAALIVQPCNHLIIQPTLPQERLYDGTVLGGDDDGHRRDSLPRLYTHAERNRLVIYTGKKKANSQAREMVAMERRKYIYLIQANRYIILDTLDGYITVLFLFFMHGGRYNITRNVLAAHHTNALKTV